MTPDERPLKPALIRGFCLRCPNCGTGRIMSGYLGIQRTCPDCGEEFYHHRADDGPAYLTILIVGHLLGPLILWAFVEYRPDPWVLVAIFSVGTIILSLALLPRLKGAFVALQWSRRMHGFSTR